MIKDIKGEILKDGQKVKVVSGDLIDYIYTLEHCLDPNEDPKLHIDIWELVEYDDNGERVKSKIAETFDGIVEKINDFKLSPNMFTEEIKEITINWVCVCGKENKTTSIIEDSKFKVKCNFCKEEFNYTISNR